MPQMPSFHGAPVLTVLARKYMLSYVYLPVIYTKIDLGMQKITHANIFYLPHTACVKQCTLVQSNLLIGPPI